MSGVHLRAEIAARVFPVNVREFARIGDDVWVECGACHAVVRHDDGHLDWHLRLIRDQKTIALAIAGAGRVGRGLYREAQRALAEVYEALGEPVPKEAKATL